MSEPSSGTAADSGVRRNSCLNMGSLTANHCSTMAITALPPRPRHCTVCRRFASQEEARHWLAMNESPDSQPGCPPEEPGVQTAGMLPRVSLKPFGPLAPSLALRPCFLALLLQLPVSLLSAWGVLGDFGQAGGGYQAGRKFTDHLRCAGGLGPG